MKNLSKVAIIVFALIILAASNGYARNLCQKDASGYLVGYFNGIYNTVTEAKYSMNYMANHPIPDTYKGERVSYDLFYNTYEGYYADLKEMYKMRNRERSAYWEGYWERLATNDRQSREMSNAFVQAKAKAIASAYEHLITHKTTLQDLSRHRMQMERYVAQGKKMLLVAHSAGNLFANVAYDIGVEFSHRLYRRGKADSDRADNIKIINVAPASKYVRGDYLLGDTDIAINDLVVGDTVSPNLYVPSAYWHYWTGCNATDYTGHSMVRTYLKSDMLYGCYHPGKYDLPYARFRSLAYNALYNLKTPLSVISEGFFEVTLQWDGPGDLDLEVEEPGLTKVYYAHRNGNSGNLDNDARTGPGLEHYYALCDSNKVTGDYKVYVNLHGGYNNVTGNSTYQGPRQARVTITSLDGRTYYASARLDADVKKQPRVHVANIRVLENGGRYYVMVY